MEGLAGLTADEQKEVLTNMQRSALQKIAKELGVKVMFLPLVALNQSGCNQLIYRSDHGLSVLRYIWLTEEHFLCQLNATQLMSIIKQSENRDSVWGTSLVREDLHCDTLE